MSLQGIAGANLNSPEPGRHYALLFTPDADRQVSLLALAVPLANSARLLVLEDTETIDWDSGPTPAPDLLGQGVGSTVAVGKISTGDLPAGPRLFLENASLSGGLATPLAVPANRRLLVFVDAGEASSFALRWLEVEPAPAP